VFTEKYRDTDWAQTVLNHSLTLKYCENNTAPEYLTSGNLPCRSPIITVDTAGIINDLCTVTIDCKKVPAERILSPHGFYYYKLVYEIGVHFGNRLTFTLSSDSKELGSAEAHYF
jgi:hypothetical protein